MRCSSMSSRQSNTLSYPKLCGLGLSHNLEIQYSEVHRNLLHPSLAQRVDLGT
jgi:hypothetical protein